MRDPSKYLPVYRQYRGLLEVKCYKKECRRLGLKEFYFAIYDEVVIAAHQEQKEVEKMVEYLIPAESLDQVIFSKL